MSGIDSDAEEGEHGASGETFGMIGNDSQVDLIVPRRAEFVVMVRPGDRARAGR